MRAAPPLHTGHPLSASPAEGGCAVRRNCRSGWRRHHLVFLVQYEPFGDQTCDTKRRERHHQNRRLGSPAKHAPPSTTAGHRPPEPARLTRGSKRRNRRGSSAPAFGRYGSSDEGARLRCASWRDGNRLRGLQPQGTSARLRPSSPERARRSSAHSSPPSPYRPDPARPAWRAPHRGWFERGSGGASTRRR